MLLSVAFGVLVACTGGEIALRLYLSSRGWTPNCYVTGLVFFVPHSSAGHTLRPNLRLRSSTYDVTTNSFGIRGPEIAATKSADDFRIVVLGGSSVFGYLVADGLDSCQVMSDLIKKDGVENVDVLNAGVPGYNMRQCRLRFESDLVALEPDIVLLYLGWNDSKFVISDQALQLERTPPAPALAERVLAQSTLYGLLRYRIFPPPAPQFAPPEAETTIVTEEGKLAFQNDLEALIAAIEDSGALAIASTQVMAAGAECSGLDDYLGSTPKQIAANRKIGQWITQTVRDTAAKSEIPLIDTATIVPCKPTMLGDAIHLTELGHREVAAAWASGLSAYLPPTQHMDSDVQDELRQ